MYVPVCVGSVPFYLTELLSRKVPKRQGLNSANLEDSVYDVPFNKTFWDRNYGINYR